MLLSCFTPLGLLELSNREAIAERIYRSMIAAHGGQFDMTPGESRQEAWCFATAMSKARLKKTIEKAGAQAFDDTVDTKIDQRESEFKIVPRFGAIIPERQAVIAKRRLRPPTWTKNRIEAVLLDLLGADLIAYRPTPLSEVARWPAALGNQPQNLQRASVARKVVRLTQAVSIKLGVLQSVTYELVDTPVSPQQSGSVDLVDGDAIVVEPEVLGITETVSNIRVGSGPTKILQGIFTKPHTGGCLCTTAPFPKWISTKRHHLVVVTKAASVDPEKRRQIDEVMRRMARASSTWDIVESSDGLSTGAFTIGESPIGAHTTVNLTF